jgi:peptidoglycan/LPS O-acetylase OafA/YrhL
MPKLTAKLAVSIYSIFIGLFMIIFWSMLVATNQILPEQIPWAISFYLAGEFATALLLIVSGVGWKSKGWARILLPLALGMLLYTVIVSPGYCAQLGNIPIVIMFSVLVALTIIALIGAFKAISGQ